MHPPILSFSFIHSHRPKYKVSETSHSYHTNMTLMIQAVEKVDIGTYTCVARNSISQDEGQIRTYEIDPPATQHPTPTPQHDTSATAPESSSNGIRTPGEGVREWGVRGECGKKCS